MNPNREIHITKLKDFFGKFIVPCQVPNHLISFFNECYLISNLQVMPYLQILVLLPQIFPKYQPGVFLCLNSANIFNYPSLMKLLDNNGMMLNQLLPSWNYKSSLEQFAKEIINIVFPAYQDAFNPDKIKQNQNQINDVKNQNLNQNQHIQHNPNQNLNQNVNNNLIPSDNLKNQNTQNIQNIQNNQNKVDLNKNPIINNNLNQNTNLNMPKFDYQVIQNNDNNKQVLSNNSNNQVNQNLIVENKGNIDTSSLIIDENAYKAKISKDLDNRSLEELLLIHSNTDSYIDSLFIDVDKNNLNMVNDILKQKGKKNYFNK